METEPVKREKAQGKEKKTLMQQYTEIKSCHMDAILFFRLGDFYEMFYDDAKLVSRELNLTLTGKDCGEPERAPMCGIPYHAADGYIARLIRRGFKVVVCEQTENPATAKGLVKREVVRIITPGTVIEGSCLEEDSNNYLCVIHFADDRAAVCFADVSTGDICATSICGGNVQERVLNELATFAPRELLTDAKGANIPSVITYFEQNNGMINEGKTQYFDPTETARRVRDAFPDQTPEELGLEDPALLSAVGALLSYVCEMQKTDSTHITHLKVYESEQFLYLDHNTRRNLELCETMRQKERRGSLLWVLDKTRSAMGARLLRKWLEMPLMHVPSIQRRQDAVRTLYDNYILREELGEKMRDVLDLERLMTRVAYGTANGRDLRAVCTTLSVVPEVKALLADVGSGALADLRDSMDELTDICNLIERALLPDQPFSIREGGMISEAYSHDVETLRKIANDADRYIKEIETKEREETGIKNLKVSRNRVYGFYIEVSKSFLPQVPPRYIRKQTLVNGERFITPELHELESAVLGAKDKLAALEYDIFCDIRRQVSEASEHILHTAEQLAQLDVFYALADVAVRNRYVCPEVEVSETLTIREGRHPVVEQVVKDGCFVPNDTALDTAHNRLALITGPNMAGKSTYMRQVALIVIMAQIGSFVPASDARVGLVDRVFTRVGASDDLASGQSTFMLEMNEVAYILRNATRRSLIIYDEIGRGTSTFDGMSLAQAVAEYSIGKKIGAKTLFATHYHELTAMAQDHPGIVNYYISARKRGDDIIFLRKILRGSADDSFGIEVAKLAGVPNDVIRRARQVLASLEAKSDAIIAPAPAEGKESDEPIAVTFSELSADELREKLRSLDVDSLSPREALDVLYDLKKRAEA